MSSGATDYRTQVLQATSIVDLISSSVALKRRGKDYVGLCPFHQEKTPSFHVSVASQFFYCFGCKASGNAIDFVMKRDRLEFVDALKQLGEQAGIEMPQYGVSREKTSQRQSLLDAQSAAALFFENLLRHPSLGADARAYLAKRGFSDQTIADFRLGFVPEGWDRLLNSSEMKKFPPALLAAGGLVKPRERGDGFYDVFRNRVMFPITDETGRTIAFGGRIMPGSPDPAKYLNSPETPLFNKSQCLFGLYPARQRLVETRTAIIVEGYTDVAMAHQYGCSNVVSVLGTALTEQHLKVLKRFVDRIVLLFDADTAGDAAVDKAVGLFLTQPIEIAIASLPTGVDPDEYLLANGREGFEKQMALATDALTFKWKQLARRYEADKDLTSQQKAISEYLELLSSARGSGPVDSIRWGAALARVSRLIEIPVSELNRKFGTSAAKRTTSTQVHPAAVPTVKVPSPMTWTGQDRAERWILGALLLEPSLWQGVQQHVGVELFTDPLRKKLAEVYWTHQRNEGEPAFNELLATLVDPAVKQLAVELLTEADGMPDHRECLKEALGHLVLEAGRMEERKLVAALRRNRDDTPAGAQDEIDLLRSLEEKARKPDIRRAGLK